MRKQTIERKRALLWRVVFSLALIMLSIWVLFSHRHTLARSVAAAGGAQIPWLILACVLMAGTFCVAAGTYSILALHRLRYTQTFVVEVAAAFVNRLLPAGLGGLGLNGVYLFRRCHTAAEATAVVSVNNLLGMCGHLALLFIVVVFQPETMRILLLRHHVSLSFGWAMIFVGIAIALAVLVVPAARRSLHAFVWNLMVSVRRLHRLRIIVALSFSVLLTTSYTFILLCTARAVGIHLQVLDIFIIFSFGILVGTIVPVPGGLVGVEAALFAGFVAYGVSDVSAAAIVLLFRGITYWLPLLPGAIALAVARNRAWL